MIFESFADFVTRRAKLILVIWIAVLLLSIYPAMHATEKLSYEMSSMGGSTSESIDGMTIFAEHFESIVSSEDMPMIIVQYTEQDDGIIDTIKDNISKISEKGDCYQDVTLLVKDDIGHGLRFILFGVSYNYTYLKEKNLNQEDFIKDDTKALRSYVQQAVASQGENHVKTYVTGSPAISYDAGANMMSDLEKIDPLSILLILLLVGLFFRSFITSATPPMTIGVAFVLVLSSLYFIAQVLEIYYVTEMLLLVSMLGAGCDYCIFILSRYREERRQGKEHIPACKEAITWAGESVATSGIAVMIGFGAMMMCSFRLISYMGLGLAIGIMFALLAALTLMSSLLVLLGDRLFWPTGANSSKLNFGYMKKMAHVGSRYFEASTHFSIKHAKVIVLATILFTVPMTYVYLNSNNSYDMIGSMMSGESRDGMSQMIDNGMGGSMMPNYVIFELKEPLGTVEYNVLPDGTKVGKFTWSGTLSEGLRYNIISISTALMESVETMNNVSDVYFDQLSAQAQHQFQVDWAMICMESPIHGEDQIQDSDLMALALTKAEKIHPEAQPLIKKLTPLFSGESPYQGLTAGEEESQKIIDYVLYVSTGTVGVTKTGDTTQDANFIRMTMQTKEGAMSDQSIKTVDLFKDKVHQFATDNPDFIVGAYVTGTAAVMVEISEMMNVEFLKIELTAILLILILLLFVLKSYLTPIRAVATIFMSVIWTIAITHLLFGDLLHQGVIWVLPIILVVICLGLGMDYDILLTTRIREYHKHKGMTNDEAISQAVLHSGSVITICGVIMGGAFGTLMFSSTVMLQQMGFALFFAILVDALIVRTYIVPAAMHLLGEWNWKGPGFLTKGDKN